jgi:hypothetical protein
MNLMWVSFSTTRNPTHHIEVTDVITITQGATWLSITTVDGLTIEIPEELVEDLSWRVQ